MTTIRSESLQSGSEKITLLVKKKKINITMTVKTTAIEPPDTCTDHITPNEWIMIT